MSEISRRRAVFGRLLTGIGFVWFFWALFSDLVPLDVGSTPVDLPILPGFVMLFLGRALSRGERSRPTGPDQGTAQRPQPTKPVVTKVEPRRAPPAPPPTEPLLSRDEQPVAIEEAVIVEEPGMGEEPLLEPVKAGPDRSHTTSGTSRMTSAEMVAEARKRFGKKLL